MPHCDAQTAVLRFAIDQTCIKLVFAAKQCCCRGALRTNESSCRVVQSAVLLLSVVVHTVTCLIKVDTAPDSPPLRLLCLTAELLKLDIPLLICRSCRFMAPETLRSEVYPASDVWAAGVMAHQLLTGRFPFDDRSNPFAPSLSKVW
jgi:serine/threonine protein kinase